MNRELVLIHTVPPLVDVFNRLCAELLPGVRIMHILDEPLLERVSQRGRLATDDVARMVEHVAVAEQVGAGAVLVTCSTVSPCVDDVRPQTHIPVLKIDELMIAEAVALGTRIGVVATNATTLVPTRSLLEAQAQRVRKPVEVELMLVEGALPALLDGDGATHDRLVRQAVLELGARCDVVVLAQASIARVLAVIPESARLAPVLSSPHLALAQIKTLLED